VLQEEGGLILKHEREIREGGNTSVAVDSGGEYSNPLTQNLPHPINTNKIPYAERGVTQKHHAKPQVDEKPLLRDAPVSRPKFLFRDKNNRYTSVRADVP